MQEVTIRSGDVGVALLYNATFLSLTGVSASIQSTDSTERVTKPILKQLSDFLERGDTHPVAVAADNDASAIRVTFPESTSVQSLSERLLTTPPILQYDLLEHVVKDVQLQLSYMIAKGVSVHTLSANDIYAVEVEPEHWRYVLLTESISVKGGSTAAFLAFLQQYVGHIYLGTKLFAYVKRLEKFREAEWI